MIHMALNANPAPTTARTIASASFAHGFSRWSGEGENLVRNLEIGLARSAELGGAMRVGYIPDQFGHTAQLPQILRGFGFDQA